MWEKWEVKKKMSTKCSTEAISREIFISVWAKLGTGQSEVNDFCAAVFKDNREYKVENKHIWKSDQVYKVGKTSPVVSEAAHIL